MLTQTKIDTLKSYFSNSKEVVAVYLYGSHARETANVLSDIDIAVMLPYQTRDSSKLHLNLIGDLTRILKSDNVDVQLLTPQPPPQLALRMLRGTLLYYRSHKEKTALTAQIFSRIEDFQPFHTLQITHMEKRLKEGTYAH